MGRLVEAALFGGHGPRSERLVEYLRSLPRAEAAYLPAPSNATLFRETNLMGRKPDPKVWGCLLSPCPFRHTTPAERASTEWLDAHLKPEKPPTGVVFDATLADDQIEPEPPTLADLSRAAHEKLKVRAKPAPKAKPEPPPFTPEHPDGLVRFARSVWPSLLPGTKVVVRLPRPVRNISVRIIDASERRLTYSASGGVYEAPLELIEAIYWHPDETGVGLRELADA